MSGVAQGGDAVVIALGDSPAFPVARNLWLLHGAMAAHFAAGLMATTVGPVIFVAMSGRPELAGVPPATFVVASAFAAQGGGYAMDRLGRIPVLATAFVLGALGFAGAALAVRLNAPAFLIASFSLQGAATGIVMLTRLAAADMRPPSLQPRAVALVLSGSIPGAIAAAVTFPRMGFGGAGPWNVGAGVMLLGAVLVLGVRPDPKSIAGALARGAGDRAGSGRPTAGPGAPAESARREIAVTLLAWLGCHSSKIALVPLAGVVVIRAGHSPDDAFAVVAAHMVGMFLLVLLVGEIVRRIGPARALQAGLALTVASVAALAAARSIVALAAAYSILGLGWSIANIAATANLARLTPPATRGRLLGLADFAGNGVGAALALGAGYALSRVSVATVALATAVLVAGLAAAHAISRRHA